MRDTSPTGPRGRRPRPVRPRRGDGRRPLRPLARVRRPGAGRGAAALPVLGHAGDGGPRRGAGWRTVQVAEEAVIDLPGLAFTGKAWQDVRTALNQAAKLGMTHRLVPAGEAAPRGSGAGAGDLRGVGGRQGSAGDGLHPRRARRGDGSRRPGRPGRRRRRHRPRVTSWMPVYGPGGGEPVGWTLDVMRRLPGGFRHTMEFLIASACLAFQDEGASGLPVRRAAGPGRRQRRTTTTAGRSTPSWTPWARRSSRTTASARCRRSSRSSSRARPAVPRLPRRGRPPPDRARAQPGVPAGGRRPRPAVTHPTGAAAERLVFGHGPARGLRGGQLPRPGGHVRAARRGRRDRPGRRRRGPELAAEVVARTAPTPCSPTSGCRRRSPRRASTRPTGSASTTPTSGWWCCPSTPRTT